MSILKLSVALAAAVPVVTAVGETTEIVQTAKC